MARLDGAVAVIASDRASRDARPSGRAMAKQSRDEGRSGGPGSPRRFAPRDDDSIQTHLALTHARERRRLQNRVRYVGKNGPVLLALFPRGDPITIGEKCSPFLLPLGKRLPRQEVGEFMIGFTDQGRPEASLPDAVFLPQPQRLSFEPLQ